MPGRPPTPTAILKIRGSRKATRRKFEPQPEKAVGHGPPAWLKDIGQQMWRETSAKLETLGVLTVIDLNALSLYCHAWAEFHETQAIIDKEGMTVTGEKGAPYQHPCVGIRNKAADRMRKYEAAFGMTPADRTRVHGKQPKTTKVATRKRA